MLQDESGRRDADGGSSFPQKHSVLERIIWWLSSFIFDKQLLYIYAILYKLSVDLAVQQITELFTGRVIFKQEM